MEPTSREKTEILQDIMRTIEDEEIDDFADLMKKYLDEVEYISVISTKAYSINKVIDAIWKKHHPDYAKPIRVVESCI